MGKMSWRTWASLGLATLVMSVGLAATGHAQDADETTWLGVYTQSISDGLRDGIDYDGDGGVLVNRVVDGSPADEAGIEKGDVIVSVNSRAVDSPDALARIVRASRPGQSVAIRIVRDGDAQTLTARLEARPSGNDSDDGMDFEWETPTPPAPHAAPRAPRTPRAPRVERFNMPSPETPETPRMRMFQMSPGRGRLGVRVETLSPELGDYFDAPEGRGVVVMEVVKGSAAEKAGLKAGDVVTHVGSRAIADTDDLVDALNDEDGRVSLTVVRKGTKRTIEATLDRAPRAMRFGPGNDLMGRDLLRLRDLRDGREGGTRRSIDKDDRGEMKREIEALRRQIDALEKELEDRDR